MFTGIVSAVGTVAGVQREDDRLRLTIAAPYADVETGESIAVNGACLTVTSVDGDAFAVDVVATTRGRTTLGSVTAGDRVNLERALRVGDRLGGHFVQGHVDGVGEVVAVGMRDDAMLVDVRVPADVAEVSVLHGSITVDGVSLTVNARPDADVVQVSLIPHTRDHTTLGRLAVGMQVQVEADMLGKMVRALLDAHRSPGRAPQ
jgi:riboflavin synthase